MEAARLIDSGPPIRIGQRFRCKGKYPYEDVVDFMVIESLKDASSHQLLVVSGFMAGRVHCDIPNEAINDWGAIDRAWMIEHWPTIYPDCPVEDVWVMGYDLPELPVPDEQTGGRRMHVSPELSSALHIFSYWIANGTVGMPLLEGIDYLSVCQEEPSLLQTTYAIFVNNLEIDENGSVLNYEYAEKRAAQYLRQYCDEDYEAEPPFRYFEVELY